MEATADEETDAAAAHLARSPSVDVRRSPRDAERRHVDQADLALHGSCHTHDEESVCCTEELFGVSVRGGVLSPSQQTARALSPTAIVGYGAGAITIVGEAERRAENHGMSWRQSVVHSEDVAGARSRQFQATCDFPKAALRAQILQRRPEPNEKVPAC